MGIGFKDHSEASVIERCSKVEKTEWCEEFFLFSKPVSLGTNMKNKYGGQSAGENESC